MIGDNQLSAADSYRLLDMMSETDHLFWGYGVEAPQVNNSREILDLIRSDNEAAVELYMRKQALLFYEVTDTEGPTRCLRYWKCFMICLSLQ